MKNNVEATANEAMAVDPKEAKDTPKYPTHDIQRMTSAESHFEREIIRMHATGPVTYDKYYSPLGVNSDGSAKPIRRTKHVKLPVSVDGKKFANTEELWEYLTASGGYSRVPMQARRDKISRR